ncbi:MAG TPA: extracellular solute-binding protein [candidate division Zixibacteria bacterium]|nr:extracellular solute-binding protein [candidate division Zixibacteria bacterium]
MGRTRAFLWLVGCCLAPALAQPWAAEKEWQEAIAGAKKEGKVVVAGSPDPVMRNEVIPRFSARFGIPVEFIAGRSSQIAARVQAERSAGIYSVDVYLSGPDTTAVTLYGGKLIDPVGPLLVMPEVADGSKWKTGKVWLVDPEQKFVVRPFSSVATLLFINTDHVKPEEMRSVKDLLNPKWRGKISVEDPTTTGAGANAAARFYSELGEEFVKSFYIDQKPVRTRDRRQMTDWLARGTQPVCLNCREDDVRPLIKDGLRALEVFELSGMRPTVNGSPWLLTVANRAPHPRAAQVFANWMLSREGLEIYARGYGSATLRTDVDESFLKPENIPKPGVKYFDDTEWKWVVTGRREHRTKVWKLLKGR